MEIKFGIQKKRNLPFDILLVAQKKKQAYVGLRSRGGLRSISVCVGFVWSLLGNSNVFGLLIGEDCQSGLQFGQVESSNFFIEMFGKCIHSQLEVVVPNGNLSKSLIGEAV